MSKASEYLNDLVVGPQPASWHNKGPGQVVLELSQEKRDLLKTLKSEDLTNQRFDSIWGTPEDWKRWNSRKN
jgi:hypothetical protein